MEKQQTAVEWLYERLERMIPRTALYNIDKKEYLEQAKKMENQKLIEMHDKGFDSVKQLNDDYAIDFAEWYHSANNNEYHLYPNLNIGEHLKIFKKEKGL